MIDSSRPFVLQDSHNMVDFVLTRGETLTVQEPSKINNVRIRPSVNWYCD